MTKNDPSDGELLQLWNDGASLGTWRKALATAQADGNLEHAQSAQTVLDKLIERGATLLRALDANAELVKRLTGQRWLSCATPVSKAPPGIRSPRHSG